jgi:hypothetical protein
METNPMLGRKNGKGRHGSRRVSRKPGSAVTLPSGEGMRQLPWNYIADAGLEKVVVADCLVDPFLLPFKPRQGWAE